MAHPFARFWRRAGLFAELIRGQQPDAEGHVIPLNARAGSVDIGSAQGPAEPMNVVVTEVVFNARTGTCNCICFVCHGSVDVTLSPNPASCPVSGTAQMQAISTWDSGSQYDRTSTASWSSSDASIATVQTAGQTSPGLVNGVAAGSATVTAFLSTEAFFTDCAPFPSACPKGTGGSGPVNVQALGSFKIIVTSTPVTGENNSVLSGQAAQVRVEALDTQGFSFTGYRGTVHFSSTDTQATLPGDYTFTAADNAVHTFNVTLKTVLGTGPMRDLTVKDTAKSVQSTQNIFVWWQVTMDVEFWKNCGFTSCPNPIPNNPPGRPALSPAFGEGWGALSSASSPQAA